ncbi:MULTISPECIES: sulfite exporter TauE/SafE family protein [unclassified Brenneria]|uniref:sulfite exporter TauE/SafE family protein n=1 Tax=unclassified Brenneria TaxID=2634434 RepID=UPI0018F082CF|nr:sulfite exporter TauE/SafE family protein [Brenneria sp. L3-3C-1]MBJ7221872.1 sulfite exporter TauE/SafE family protein [Brenneria sp. L3-3C-1]MEE3643115.1 sulfite exporter TauE/SafE family protein [Brenneria sp. L3_3C_1]
MAVILIVFLLAGMVKGIIGVGLPTIAMGLLTLTMSPTTAAGVLIIPSLVTNIWQLICGPAFLSLVKRFWSLFAGIIIGTLWGGLPTLTSSSSWTGAAIGLILVLYGIWGILAKKLPQPGRHEVWLSPLAGYVTGAIAAATGVFVIPAVPYLQCLGLNKHDLVQSLGLAFTVSTIGLAIQLAQGIGLSGIDLGISCFALLPAILGMVIGQRLRHRISEKTFRQCFFAGLMTLGGYMFIPFAAG